ncbi:hypothetical protein KAR91_59595 [Candidatus Pacearchaeota archaeon]|nr:hypothetical protein [Candidatus Pacearchaeota archaeon]
MKLRYLLKLIQQGSISIIVPNKFEGTLLQHRIGNTEVKIISVDKWTMADLTYNIVIEFPNDIPTSTLQIIEQSAANVIYSEEIL